MATIAELTTKEAPKWCPGCVLPGTFIQSNPSVKKIETIKTGERVLGKDGKFHKVTEVMVHRHKGKMYRITSKCFGSTVLTDEHPVLCSRREKVGAHNKIFSNEWVRADSLRSGDYLVYPILSEIEDKDFVEVDWKKPEMDRKSKPLSNKLLIGSDLLRLAGYYIAEGYVHRGEITFTFNEKEVEYVDDIKSIVKKIFGLAATSKIRENKHTNDINVSSAPLARLFKEWFDTGAASKKIPHFMMLLPLEKQRELLKGMWRGDGYVGKKKAGYKTISKVLSEQAKMLLLRQSIVPTVSENKPYGMHKKFYGLEVCGAKNLGALCSMLSEETPENTEKTSRPRFAISKTHVMLPIRDTEIFDYDGDVYNFEVEDVHCYVSDNAILHNCGDFTILSTVKNAISELGLEQHNTLVVSGIGCGSKVPHFMKTYGFEGLHGRGLPVATGAKLANNKLTVLAISGDGDTYGIGGNHFMHTMRRNLDITLIVQNNEVYGLTKGQTSPTSEKGFKTNSTPNGVLEEPVNPMTWSIAAGATYVARGYAMDIMHLKKLIVDAVRHKGFSIIDVFQPCPTYNKVQTADWYKQRIFKLDESGHDTSDKIAAIKMGEMWGEKIPIGLFYKVDKPTYEDGTPQIATTPLVKQDISKIDISGLLAKFK